MESSLDDVSFECFTRKNKEMKIFIDIGHPAHVHYFRNFIKIMKNKGHTFLVTARDKEMTHKLLDENKIDFISRGKGGIGLLNKFFYLFKANFLIYKLSKKFKPNFFISFSSPYVAQISTLIQVPHIGLTDTEHAVLGNLAFVPFSKYIITPSCYKKKHGKKHTKFNGYMELCYLHPNFFVPDLSILNELNISPNDKYTIVRFVSWEATHDIGHNGITLINKIKAVKEFSKYGKVYISSEFDLPNELNKYKINIPPNKMHDVLANASLLYGESATMASESAMLGTPAIFVDSSGRGYTDELESEYGIVFNFNETLDDQKKSITKGIEILKMNDGKKTFNKIKNKIIKDKINPIDFIIDFITNIKK